MSSLFQNAFYISNNVNDILYGIELVLFCMTMSRLFNSERSQKRSRYDNFLAFFSIALLVLNTIYVAVQGVFGEEMWIVNADYLGGSAAYLADYAAVWYQTMGTTATVMLNLFADAYMIYRCHVVWNDMRIIFFPCVIYVATLALGILLLYSSGSPSADFFSGLSVKFGLSYYSLTIGLNIILTCLILGRIIYLSKAVYVPQKKSSLHKYISIVVESALPYSVAGIAWLVSYGMESDIQIFFGGLYAMFTCISPQMIVLRVVQGRAWSRDQALETMSALALRTVRSRMEGDVERAESASLSNVDAKSVRSVGDGV